MRHSEVALKYFKTLGADSPESREKALLEALNLLVKVREENFFDSIATLLDPARTEGVKEKMGLIKATMGL